MPVVPSSHLLSSPLISPISKKHKKRTQNTDSAHPHPHSLSTPPRQRYQMHQRRCTKETDLTSSTSGWVGGWYVSSFSFRLMGHHVTEARSDLSRRRHGNRGESYLPDPSAVLVCCSVLPAAYSFIFQSAYLPVCPSIHPLPTTPIHPSISLSNRNRPSDYQPRTYTHTYTPKKNYGISLDTYIHIHTYTYTYTYEDDSLGMSLVMGMGACVTCEVGGWVHRW